MRATQLDIFSRLMMDRIIWVSGPVESQMASIIQAQLIFLETTDKKDISMYLDTPGGSVLSGLGIRDTMNYIKPDVATLNVGMCASMGSVLVSSGAKGKRSSLIFSKIMTHMVSHGTQGNVQDTRINQLEAEKYNYMLFKILAENCGKTFDEMYESSRNDKWFNSDEYNTSIMVWESKISFEPIVGKSYFLYNFAGELTLSLIAPNEWVEKRLYVNTY